MNFKEDKLWAGAAYFSQAFRTAAGRIDSDVGKMFQEKLF
jgi:hypothetical protein